MPDINNKPLQKYKFQWKIKNFGFLLPGIKVSLLSPIFHFKIVQKTSWRLYLSSDKVYTNMVNIEIRRLSKQYEHDLDKVILRATISVLNNNIICGQICTEEISLSTLQKFIISNFDKNLVLKNLSEKNYVTVVLELETVPKMLHKEINFNGDCEMLSLDMKKLYETKLLSDVTIYNNDEPIKAHRAVLEARWPSILQVLCENLIPTTFFLPLSASTLAAILQYVYTGKLDMEELPPGFYQNAIIFNLVDLVNKSESIPVDVICETGIEIFISVFECSLNKENFLEENSFPFTRVIKTDQIYMKSTIDMHITIDILNGVEDNAVVQVFLQFPGVCSDKPIAIKSNISIFANNNLCISRKFSHVFVDDTKWLFPFRFFVSNFLMGNFHGKNMTLVCKTEFTFGNYKSKISDSYMEIPARAQPVDDTQSLSIDISNLLDNSTNSDLAILCGEQVFNAHKSILSCRSQKFYNLIISDEVDHKVLHLNDIKPEILNLLLNYIYGKNLSEGTIIQHIYDLDKAALQYEVRSLKEKCEAVMKSNLL